MVIKAFAGAARLARHSSAISTCEYPLLYQASVHSREAIGLTKPASLSYVVSSYIHYCLITGSHSYYSIALKPSLELFEV